VRSPRVAGHAAIPPSTRACCHLEPSRPGGVPTFQLAARTVLEPAALLPLRPLRQRAHRRAAEGHPERRAMRRRRRVRARRAARQHLRTCRMRVCQGRQGGQRRRV